MLKKDIITNINKMSIKESWQKELIIKNNNFHLTILCLHIKDIELDTEYLRVTLDNRREYLFLNEETLEFELMDRFDLKLIEEGVSKLEKLRRKRKKVRS